jgi:ribonucleotide monophosphatase NagD (HAD superfamily)
LESVQTSLCGCALQGCLLGKPAKVIYDTAMHMLGLDDRKKVIAIGDSLEHDIAGACARMIVLA